MTDLSTPDLWVLSVMFRQPGCVLQFRYKGENMARKAREEVGSALVVGAEGTIQLADQYGKDSVIVIADIMGADLTHVAEDLDGATQMGLAQARAQSKANTLAAADMKISSPLARAAPPSLSRA